MDLAPKALLPQAANAAVALEHVIFLFWLPQIQSIYHRSQP
jgi:hypothetical protein